MADKLPHGRPAGRAPSRPRSLPPHVLAERIERERWRRERAADPERAQRLDRLLHGLPAEPGEEWVLIDSDRTVVAGPFACLDEAAGKWEPMRTWIRQRLDNGNLRAPSEDEKARAWRVREAAA